MMAGVWSRAVLFLAVVLLSAHSVYCRPTTRPPLSIPSFFPNFNFSFDNYFVPRVPTTVSTQVEQERRANIQLLGLAGLIIRYGPIAADCIRRFRNSPEDISTNTIQASAQFRQFLPAIRDCISSLIGIGRQKAALSQAKMQTVASQQSQDWSVFCNVMDAVMNEPDSIAAPNTQTAAVSQETQQQTQQAAAQTPVFRSLGNFAYRYWPIARECLNDLLNRNENDQGDPDATVNEFERIWKRQTQMNVQSTEVASSQIRQFWPAIRDCVERFVNGNIPTDRTGVQTDLDVQLQRYLMPSRRFPFQHHRAETQFLFGQRCSDALYIMAFTGGTPNSFTSTPPIIELTVDGETSSVLLPGLERFNFINEKGDLLKIDLSDFGFMNDCIEKWNVDGIAVLEGGTDGWLIDSIVTFLRAEDDTFTLLSSDIDVFQWIDGNGGSFQDRLDLTIV